MVDASNKDEARSFIPALIIGIGVTYFKLKDSTDWSMGSSIFGFIVVGLVVSAGVYLGMGLFSKK